MKKRKNIFILLTILVMITLLLSGCKNKKTDNNELLETKNDFIQNDIKVDIKDDKIELDLNDELISFISPDIDTKVISLNDLMMESDIDSESRLNHPQRIEPNFGEEFISFSDIRLSNIELPETVNIRYTDVAENTWIEWGYSSYMCTYELVVMENNTMYFSFGNEQEADYTWRPVVHGEILDTCLSLDKRILILHKNEDKLMLKVYTPYGDALGEFEIISENYKSNTNVQIIPKGIEEYYLLMNNNGSVNLETYCLENSAPNRMSDLPEIGVKIDNIFIRSQQLKEKIATIHRTNNLIFAEVILEEESLEKGNRYIACFDYDFQLNYLFELPTDYHLEYTFCPAPDRFHLYLSSNSGLYVYSHKVGENKLRDVIVSGDSGNLAYNGMKEQTEFYGGNNQLYNFWKVKDNIVYTINNDELWRFYCTDTELTNQTEQVVLAGGYHIGIGPSGNIVFVTPEGVAYNKDYKSPLQETLVGNSIYNYSIVSAFDNGVVYIEKSTGDLVWVSDLGEEKVIATLDLTDVAKIDDQGNELYFAIHDFEKHFIMADGMFMVILNKTNGQITTKELEGYVHFDYAIGTYTYDNSQKYYYDFESQTFTSNRYPFIEEVYSSFAYKDTTYINTYDEYVNENTPKFLTYIENPFVDLEIDRDELSVLNLNVVDMNSIKSDEETRYFAKTYQDQQIYDLVPERYLKLIIDGPVRSYEVSSKGILYNGYEENAYCYFYDFKSEETMKLNSKNSLYSNAIALTESYAFSGNGQIISSYSIDEAMSEVASIDIQKLFENNNLSYETEEVGYCLVGGQQGNRSFVLVIARNEEKIFLLDAETLNVIQIIDGEDAKVREDGLIFYDKDAFVLSYDIENSITQIVDYIFYPSLVDFIGHNLLIYIGYDGPGDYNVIDTDKNLLKNSEYDYVIFTIQTDYSENLSVYDNANHTFSYLCNTNQIEYTISEEGLSYRYKNYDENGWSEWTNYSFAENSTYTIY